MTASIHSDDSEQVSLTEGRLFDFQMASPVQMATLVQMVSPVQIATPVQMAILVQMASPTGGDAHNERTAQLQLDYGVFLRCLWSRGGSCEGRYWR